MARERSRGLCAVVAAGVWVGGCVYCGIVGAGGRSALAQDAPQPPTKAPAVEDDDPFRDLPSQPVGPGQPPAGGGAGPAAGTSPAQPEVPKERLAVPPKAAQERALKLVRDIYADDYKKKATADRAALASRLLDEAEKDGNEPAARFAVLVEARDLAAAAGDAATAMKAIDRLDDAFKVEPASMRNDALAVAAKAAGSDAGKSEAVAEAYLDTVGDALAAGDLDAAAKAAQFAETIARKAGSAVTDRAAALRKELKALQAQYAVALPAARAKLESEPDNAVANLLVGKFLCLVVGDWPGGLPHLAKGADPVMQKGATLDLQNPTEPALAGAVGDAWFDLGERNAGIPRSHLYARAKTWYERALDGLAGLEKTRVEKRLAAIKQAESATTTAAGDRNAVKVLDALTRAIPEAARPKTSDVNWRGEALNDWLKLQDRKVKLEGATLTVDRVDDRSRGGFGGFAGRGGRVTVRFDNIGPVEAEGTQYELLIRIEATDDKARDAFKKLERGTKVKLSGVLDNLRMAGFPDPAHVVIETNLAGLTIASVRAPSASTK